MKVVVTVLFILYTGALLALSGLLYDVNTRVQGSKGIHLLIQECEDDIPRNRTCTVSVEYLK